MSTRSRHLPIWTRPEPGLRRPRFSRAEIAAAALKIADEEGFDAVSMRRVAAALGAGTMTLYHYVRTRDDLAALMDDAIMAEVLVPAGELPSDWRGALTAIARRTRDVFVRHPWALLGLRQAMPGPNGMRHFEQSLAAVANLPVSMEARQDLLLLVDDFVFGHMLRTMAFREMPALGADAMAALRSFGEAQLATGAYPHIAAMVEAAGPDAFPTLDTVDQRFEAGLATILDGAAKRLGLE